MMHRFASGSMMGDGSMMGQAGYAWLMGGAQQPGG
jgi:hypothetical protein